MAPLTLIAPSVVGDLADVGFFLGRVAIGPSSFLYVRQSRGTANVVTKTDGYMLVEQVQQIDRGRHKDQDYDSDKHQRSVQRPADNADGCRSKYQDHDCAG